MRIKDPGQGVDSCFDSRISPGGLRRHHSLFGESPAENGGKSSTHGHSKSEEQCLVIQGVAGRGSGRRTVRHDAPRVDTNSMNEFIGRVQPVRSCILDGLPGTFMASYQIGFRLWVLQSIPVAVG
jgi:hypothetical protein